jgi:transketolase C-terminal domain/subunit|tara:strand:- start:489 stop:608 length:120 start_codon:yes stop_codon:yes gene_type:complete
MATTKRETGIIGMAIGLAVLGLTVYVIGYAWEKGRERAS